MSRRGAGRFLIPAVVGMVSFGWAAACSDDTRQDRAVTVDFGDAETGRVLIDEYGCGSCHRIPGVKGADGLVGPPLDDFGLRSYIGGQLANTPENLVRWLMDPQRYAPGTAMPDLDLSEADARNITAYLEGLD